MFYIFFLNLVAKSAVTTSFRQAPDVIKVEEQPQSPPEGEIPPETTPKPVTSSAEYKSRKFSFFLFI